MTEMAKTTMEMTEMARVVGIEKFPTQNAEVRIMKMIESFHLEYSGGHCGWLLEDGKRFFTIIVNKRDGRDAELTVKNCVKKALSRIFEEEGWDNTIIAVN